MGETYNLSVHVRCDITDPNQQAFAIGWETDPVDRHVKGYNVKDYQWFTVSIKGEEYNCIHKLYLQTLSGASKCYVDKVRFFPIKTAENPYVPPKIQEFTFNPNLPPMGPVDMFQPNYIPPPPVQPTRPLARVRNMVRNSRLFWLF